MQPLDTTPQQDATGLDPALSLTHTLREAARHGSGAVLLCSFQKEESVLIDELLRLDQGTGRAVRIVTIDTGVLFPETLADLARVRGALRHRGRGVRREQPGEPVDRT